MIIYAYNALFVSLCHLGLALFVLLRDPRRSINICFFLVSMSVCFWSFGIYKHTLSTEIVQAHFWDQFLHLSSIFIPWTMIYFALRLTQHKRDIWVTFIDVFNSVIFLTFLLMPDWYLIEIPDKPHFNFFPTATPGYFVYSLVFFLSVTYTVFLLVSTYRTTESYLLREQIKYFFLGMAIGYAGTSTNFLAVFFKGVYPVGFYFAPVFALSLAYTIVKHTLMEIDVFIKRSLMYLGLFLALFIPSYLLILFLQNVLLPEISFTFTWLVMGVFLLFALSFFKLNQIIEPKLIQMSKGKGYNYQEIITRINHGINQFSNLNELLDYLTRMIAETIDVKQVILYVKDKDGVFHCASYVSPQLPLEKLFQYQPSEGFLSALLRHDAIFTKEDARSRMKRESYQKAFNEMETLQAHLAVPVKYEDSLEGILLMGEKEKKHIFTQHDFDLLKIVSVHIGSILNIESYRVIEELNVHLQEKTKSLEEAMEELKNAQAQLVHSAKLASVGGLAAGVAHEINNALNAAILGNVHLKNLLEHASKNETLKKFVDDAKDDVRILSNGMNRAHSVVKNLLTFSQKNNEGFRNQHVHEGLNSSVQMIHNELHGRIEVHKEFCEDDLVFCDLSQLNQVFLNILKNGVDAIKDKGNIWIQTRKEGEEFVISIRNDGPQVPQEAVDKIFDPFYTSKGVGKGTGLGLSVSYNVIKNHHGTLECRNLPENGVEFLIKLPIKINTGQEQNEQRKAI